MDDFNLADCKARPEDYARFKGRRKQVRAKKTTRKCFAMVHRDQIASLAASGVFNWPTVIFLHLVIWGRTHSEPMPTTALNTGCPWRTSRHRALRVLEAAGVITLREGEEVGSSGSAILTAAWKR